MAAVNRNQLQLTFCHFVVTFPERRSTSALAKASFSLDILLSLCHKTYKCMFYNVFVCSGFFIRVTLFSIIFNLMVLDYVPAFCILLLSLIIELLAVISNKSSSILMACLHLYSFDFFSKVSLSTHFPSV